MFDVQLSTKLNEFDPLTGGVPIHIALVEQQESIAKQLVTNGCDVNVPDSDGHCLLHKAIQRGDEFAATFLIKNEAKINAVTVTDEVTPLHLAASYKYVLYHHYDNYISLNLINYKVYITLRLFVLIKLLGRSDLNNYMIIVIIIHLFIHPFIPSIPLIHLN